MSDLDTSSLFKYDSSRMIDQVESFSTDCIDAWQQAENLILPSYYVKAKNILLLGMGGSGVSNDFIADLLYGTDLCINSIHGYDIPGLVDENTLVIANSYSGNTEEVLAGFISAYKRKAKLIAITTGGKLESLAEKYRAPLFKYNYPSTPRMAVPFTFVSLLSIFKKLGHLEIDNSIFDLLEKVNRLTQNYRHEIPVAQNPAKALAQKLEGNIPIIYSSFSLKSLGFRAKSQFNENSKNLSFSEYYPELNHNSIQGYRYPKAPVFVISVESNLDDSQSQKRANLTEEVLRKSNIPCERINFSSVTNPVVEILSFIQFFNYVSIYLAVINMQDPTSMPDITTFKSKL
ncbi:MAG: bifunctional phosphoglucose/phosphomannose isomerase [Patescibacteria group bacterium]